MFQKLPKPPNPHRDQAGRYVSWAKIRLGHEREKLLTLRSLAPVVYADSGPFASLGKLVHENALKQQEIMVGLWEGRSEL